MKSRILISLALAALVAAGSAGAAQLIGSSQIKDHSIKLRDLSRATVKTLHGARGPQGTAGPAGPVGPPGAQGAPGSNATVSWVRVQGPDTVVANGNSGTATASCPAGMQVSGGGFLGTSNFTITREDASDGTWRVSVKSTAGGGLQSVVNAVAFCVTATAG